MSTLVADASTYPELYPVTSGGEVWGTVQVPPSKSLTQRYFALALVGDLDLTVHRPLLAEDTELFLGALRACGMQVSTSADRVRLRPGRAAVRARREPETVAIECGNGGTMLRFLTAVLTAVPGRFRLDGTARLRERPVGPLVQALQGLGARLDCPRGDGCPPVEIVGSSLLGGQTRLDAGESSQYLSAVLLASLAAQNETSVELAALTSEPYVALTLASIAELGGRVEALAGGGYRILPGALHGGEVWVERDYSAAAYPAAAAALTGGTVHLPDLAPRSLQGDRAFLDLLGSMGARLSWSDAGLTVSGSGSGLRAVEADLSNTPDQVPTLAALAPFARGTTVIRNVAHLRIKESDRLAAMARELGRLGVEVEELADGLRIEGCWAQGPTPSAEQEVDTWGDHRIAMALALVGLRRPGVVLRQPSVVRKSYPDFFLHLETLLAGPRVAG